MGRAFNAIAILLCTAVLWACGGSNPSAARNCTPITCTSASKNCGSLDNGCGKTLDCGQSCPSGQTCGGGGLVNVCGSNAPTIIPADRRTIWNPGLNAVGGIPNRTNIYTTLSPSGGDDTSAVNAALKSCPKDGVVQLAAGTFNVNGNGLNFPTSDCTLRGAGPGKPGSGDGGTRLIKADSSTNANYGVLYVGAGVQDWGTSTPLASDAVKGSNTLTLTSDPGLQVGEIVLLDEVSWDSSDPSGGFDGTHWGTTHDSDANGGSRRWFCRQDRSLNQMLEVTAVNGTTITFSTPFHIRFKTQYQAQLTRYSTPTAFRIGIENLYIYGGRGGDFHGNLPITRCAYCWVKNIESHYSQGTSVGLYSTFRNEVRDSYIHETPDPNPGGGGYLSGISFGGSDNLFENNIMWSGNKVVVMRASGGGNVFAYNYTDDAYGAGYPSLGEAGINAGHYTTPHMELLEGNYSQNFKGDSYWGNSIYITVFRNHLSALRGAWGSLASYTYQGYPYLDLHGRCAVDIQDYSYAHNMVGNILGLQDQKLLSDPNLPENYAQTGWTYEAITGDPGTVVPMWKAGAINATATAIAHPGTLTMSPSMRCCVRATGTGSRPHRDGTASAAAVTAAVRQTRSPIRST